MFYRKLRSILGDSLIKHTWVLINQERTCIDLEDDNDEKKDVVDILGELRLKMKIFGLK